MLHVICTRLRPGHLSVRVGDSSRRCEEIVTNLELRLSVQFIFLQRTNTHVVDINTRKCAAALGHSVVPRSKRYLTIRTRLWVLPPSPPPPPPPPMIVHEYGVQALPSQRLIILVLIVQLTDFYSLFSPPPPHPRSPLVPLPAPSPQIPGMGFSTCDPSGKLRAMSKIYLPSDVGRGM